MGDNSRSLENEAADIIVEEFEGRQFEYEGVICLGRDDLVEFLATLNEAGYLRPKPKKITSVEQLKELKVGTILVEKIGRSIQITGKPNEYQYDTVRHMIEQHGPLHVVYEPSEPIAALG